MESDCVFGAQVRLYPCASVGAAFPLYADVLGIHLTNCRELVHR